ncbi:VanZ family protein [Streptomyces sp. NPDC056480]|uniref:VanZ family protein n=1 Tax=Streptomyces sp. NPDC056480 TaxID=3345833 RepID=UPI003684402A
MIQAVFQHHLVFLATAIAVTLAAGALTCVLAARRVDRPRAVVHGLWASSVMGPVMLTTWGGSGVLTRQCTINPDVIEAFATTQGRLNVALFAPFGLFAALATRRPLFGAALGVLFTALVETAQATVPLISRLCDTDDLATNTVGVLAGAGIGAVVRRGAADGAPLPEPAVRRTAVAGAVASLLVAAAWVTAIEPVRAVLPTADPDASPEQIQALEAELRKAFGEGYAVDTASFLDNVDGPDTVSAPLSGGFAELTWPDRETLTVHFTPAVEGRRTSAYQIPGTGPHVRTADQAQQAATRFARGYAPWALQDSTVRVWSPDTGARSSGWVVAWRRRQGGVLMPMRLEIRMEPSGRLTDLVARNVDDPQVPPVTVTEDMAWRRFESQHKIAPGQGKREEPVLLAERRGDEWRVHWRLGTADAETLLSATVDAATGEVTNPKAVPASMGSPLPPEGFQGP